MSDPVILKALLQKTIRTFNLERQVNAALVCHHFRKWAGRVWGEREDRRQKTEPRQRRAGNRMGAGRGHLDIEPKSYRDGVLWVRVKDSVWAHQVQLKQAGFVEYLKEVCPEVPLKSVRTVVEVAP